MKLTWIQWFVLICAIAFSPTLIFMGCDRQVPQATIGVDALGDEVIVPQAHYGVIKPLPKTPDNVLTFARDWGEQTSYHVTERRDNKLDELKYTPQWWGDVDDQPKMVYEHFAPAFKHPDDVETIGFPYARNVVLTQREWNLINAYRSLVVSTVDKSERRFEFDAQTEN
tara:strand:+ start:566 stop:1072 length:507 start_codon:yes stop_codon:yes gene_type:complete